MIRPLRYLLIALALVATACTSEGLPSSYVDQDGRAETQFVETCEAVVDGADNPPPAGYCQCAFYTVASQLTYDEFTELDKKLKDDPDSLLNPERELLESVSLPCAFDEGDINLTATES